MRFGVRELLFVVLLLGVLGASYFCLFKPRGEQMIEAREQIARKQEKLRQLEAATATMEDLGQEIDKLTEAIELYEQKLPAQREEQVILKEVWELAAQNRLKPKSVRTDKIVKSAHYAELPIKMVIVGDFDGFYSFLLQLERLQRITRTPQMTLKKANDRDQAGQMQADVVLSIFFEGEQASAKKENRS